MEILFPTGKMYPGLDYRCGERGSWWPYRIYGEGRNWIKKAGLGFNLRAYFSSCFGKKDTEFDGFVERPYGR